jgi:hypothetical protein
MKLGYILSQGRGQSDPRLAAVAQHLMRCGLRLCGTVQVNTDRSTGRAGEMDLMVLPDGPALRISQDRGPLARGCRLDAGSQEAAVAQVAGTLDCGADLMLINRLGRHEAEGHGFRSVIAEALSRGMPVLVGLNPLNREAFDTLAGRMATELPPEPGLILGWAGPPVSGIGVKAPPDGRADPALPRPECRDATAPSPGSHGPSCGPGVPRPCHRDAAPRCARAPARARARCRRRSGFPS